MWDWEIRIVLERNLVMSPWTRWRCFSGYNNCFLMSEMIGPLKCSWINHFWLKKPVESTWADTCFSVDSTAVVSTVNQLTNAGCFNCGWLDGWINNETTVVNYSWINWVINWFDRFNCSWINMGWHTLSVNSTVVECMVDSTTNQLQLIQLGDATRGEGEEMCIFCI